MIVCGTHDDYKDPPRVPIITGINPKQSKKNSFTEALTGAAEAVAIAFSPPPQPFSACMSSPTASTTSSTMGSIDISPGFKDEEFAAVKSLTTIV